MTTTANILTIDDWKENLTGKEPALQLPTDRPKTSAQIYEPASWSFTLSEPLSSGLHHLSHQEKIGVFTLLLTTLKILVYRYTNTAEIILGTAIDRHLLILKTDFSNNPTFLELAHQVQAKINQALREKPIEKLLKEKNLKPESIFQVLCAEGSSLSGAYAIDLQFYFTNLGNQIEVIIDYNNQIFDSETISRISGHYLTLLEEILANPHNSINSYRILTITEINQITQQWNNLTAEYPKDICLHQLIEYQVERTPTAIAVQFGDQNLTYQQLNNQANKLARYLQKLGIKPETCVGICADRSLEVVVGFMAVFKAGGVYVPLDPTYPKDRLAYLLEDANVPVLLTQTHLLSQLPTTNAQIICLDTLAEIISSESEENLTTNTTQKNAAYIIYTSGTTGKPKAVVAEHGNLMNYILATQDKFQFNNTDIMPCIARFSFSISLFELLAPLVAGGTTVVISRENVLDMSRLVKGFGSLTNVHLTPSLMRKAIDYINQQQIPPETFNNIRRVFMGGDTVAPDLIEDVKPIFTKAQIYVLYGCSETTTLCTNYLVSRDIKATKNIIGNTFNNVQIRLYDTYQNLVPVGIPGEIYVSGNGITRGYANREELTREKYIIIDGTRFYKTGDVGKFLRDGQIELLGRTDFQVSLRGFRIEVGEIESLLREHPQIRDAAVTAREDIPGDKRLVGYIVVAEKTVPKNKELREFLATKLPDYMIPSMFIVLESLPMTPNGKQDRKALPAPPLEQERETETEYIPPRNEIETRLAKIWQDVLNIKSIGIKDNYFELGGNSLQAVSVFAQIEKTLGKVLTIATLLQAPTIEKLAKLLESQSETVQWTSLVPLQPKGSKPPLFCIHAVGGNVLFYRNLVNHLDPDWPVYGLQSLGLDGKTQPLTTIEAMASHYLQEIRFLQPAGPYYLAGYSNGGIIAYEIAQQCLKEGEKVNLLALIDSVSPTLIQEKNKFIPDKDNFLNHQTNLSNLSLTEKGLYLLDKFSWKLVDIKRKILKNIAYFYGYQGQPLPTQLRTLLVEEANRQAGRKYIPQVYAGSAILFRATSQPARYNSYPQLGWENLVAGELEVQTVSGNHNTLDSDGVMNEPNVKVLAEKLQSYLDVSEENSR